MALFQWITQADRRVLEASLERCLVEFGIEIDCENSTQALVYASDKAGSNSLRRPRVSVIAAPCNGARDEFAVEVRSDEPMLRRGTRCEQVASALREHVPPKV